jgi:predicted RNA-binding protein with PUA domain
MVCGLQHDKMEIIYYCQDCDVALCVSRCSEAHHTKKNF